MSLGKDQGGRDVQEREQAFNQLRASPELFLIAGHLLWVLLDNQTAVLSEVSVKCALVYREQDS